MLYAYCDGSIKGGQPGGHGVAAWLVKDDNETLLASGTTDMGSYPELTNNRVEIEAVKSVLTKLIEWKWNIDEVFVFSDSQLIINQLRSEYRCVNPELKKARDEIWELACSFKKVNYHWIPRESNKQADQLSRSLYVEV